MEKKIVSTTFGNFFLPTLATSVTLSVLSMTDLIIAGRFVGENALTAISLALPVTIFIQIVSALFGTGGAIVLSAALGKGDRETCDRIFTVSLGAAVLSGLAAGLVGILFLDPIIYLCGGTGGETVILAREYMGVLFLGMPVMILSPVMMTYLRNDNEQRYAMICVVSSGIFNIVFSTLFAAAFHMGIFGIGLATVLAQLLSCVLASFRLFRENRMFHLTRFSFSFDLLFSMIRPGLPIAAIFLSQVILTVVINRTLMAEGGSQAVAVYAVIKYLINFMYALFDGVTGAIQPMLGIYYGEREQNNILYTVRCSFAAMLGIGLLMFSVMEFSGAPVCTLFGVQSGQLARMTVNAMKIQGICCLTSSIVTYANAFYRCTGNEKISFLLSIGDNLICPIGCVLAATRIFRLGVPGIWWGMVFSSLLVLLIWLLGCLKKGNGFLLLNSSQLKRPEDEFHMICPATQEQIPGLLSSVESFCGEMNISVKKEYYISLVIEELVVNVISLAQNDSRQKKHKTYYVDIRITPRENREVELRVRDNLTEFNPGDISAADAKSIMMNAESSSVNELGIGIVINIAKTYSYKRTIGFNNFSVILT